MSENPAVGAVKLSKRTIDALSVERGDKVFWDRELPGFGIRVHATGRKIYVAQARTPGGLPKRATIGRFVEMTAEEARRRAAEIIDRIRRGEDAVPPPPVKEPTVADLAERFMEAHVEVNCRPATVEVFGRLLKLYILPELGELKLTEGRPVARLGAALQSARQALPGQPGGGGVLEDVQAGRGLGHDPGAAQPVPVGEALRAARLPSAS